MEKQLLALSLAAALSPNATGCSKSTESSGDGSSAADGYSEKAITVIAPFSTDGEHGLTAHTIVTRLQEMFRWTVTTQNTTDDPAAAVGYMKSDYTDGYTLFIHSPEVMIASLVSSQLNGPYYEDSVYPGNFVHDPLCIYVTTDSPYNTIENLFAVVKEDGGINWAYVGAGGKNEMDAQNLWDIAGVSFNYVPYNDASKSRAAVLGGHTMICQSYASGAKSSVDADELKVLAVGADKRLDFWPDVLTLKKCGYDATAGLVRCWDIHPDAPQEIVDVLTERLKECVADPTTQEQLIVMGRNPPWMISEEIHEHGEYYYGVYGDIYAKLDR